MHYGSSVAVNGHSEHVEATMPHQDLASIVAAAIPEPSARVAPIYVGDGGYSNILDAAGRLTDRHFYVPATAEKILAAEDLEYLKIKGCFTLPQETEHLIEAYFRFVHSTFPMIDGAAFLQEYSIRGHEGINLLLLWSMFSASASYIPSLPRRARKETYVQRAKLLFDLGQETDKIVLVQSALLLSFWFADTEDIKQSWYWTGIALSIAQTLGLHRSVDAAHCKIPPQQRSLWRNIWRGCMIRDVWLAFGMGRPLRIGAAECGVGVVRAEDCCFADLVLHGQRLYSTTEAAGLASVWQSLIIVSNVLREILTSKILSPSQTKLLRDRISVESVSSATFLLTHVKRHFRLHQNATMIALARVSGVEELVESTADDSTAIIQAYFRDGSIQYAAPVTIPLVVPAVVTYMTAINLRRPEARNEGEDKLSVYRRFLEAIEDNYPAASIVKRLLATAQDSIVRSKPEPKQVMGMNHSTYRLRPGHFLLDN
jgi:hypothetical protein